ncbi:MAG TPA: hypothetical protein VKZ53_06110 [Candidatus Angelobacter sp.]|nr:hypothetical protein [Candidatus Angelobacter sp.]
MNAQQQMLVNRADIAAAAYGDGDTHVLIPVNDPQLIPPEVTDADTGRLLKFCGVFGILDGVPHCKCEPSREAQGTMIVASIGFVEYVLSIKFPDFYPIPQKTTNE